MLIHLVQSEVQSTQWPGGHSFLPYQMSKTLSSQFNFSPEPARGQGRAFRYITTPAILFQLSPIVWSNISFLYEDLGSNNLPGQHIINQLCFPSPEGDGQHSKTVEPFGGKLNLLNRRNNRPQVGKNEWPWVEM